MLYAAPIEPEANDGADNRERRQRQGNARYADAIGPKGDQLVIRREPPEDEQDRGQQSPGDGEDEREGQNVGDEGEEKLQRDIVVHEQREKLAKDVADHEHEAEDRDREQHVHDQLAANEAIDQFHDSFSKCRSIPLAPRLVNAYPGRTTQVEARLAGSASSRLRRQL